MNSYYRLLKDIIQKNLFIGKILVIYGPRQVGKTTLVNNILKDSKEPSKFYFGDDPIANQLFTNKGIEQLRPLIKPPKLFVNTYPNTSFEVINSNNFDKFVGI